MDIQSDTHDLWSPNVVPDELKEFIGERYGFARAIFRTATSPDSPALFVAGADHPDADEFLELSWDLDFSDSAVALTVEDAAWAGLAEFMERYSTVYPNPGQVVIGTQNALEEKGYETVGLEGIGQFADEQAEWGDHYESWIEAMQPDSTLSWAITESLVTGDEVLVPSRHVFFDPERAEGEAPIGYSMSTGSAAGRNRVWALLGGLNEAIERDAFVIHWLSKSAPPKIDIDSHPELAELYHGRLEKGDFTIELLDITTDFEYPVVLSVAKHDLGDGQLRGCLGAHADPDPVEAAKGALMEAAQGHFYMTFIQGAEGIDEMNPLGIQNLEDNVRYYSRPDNWDKMSWLLDNPETKALDDLPNFGVSTREERLEKGIELVQENGHDVLEIELTNPELKERIDLDVYKVIVPELAQLYVPQFPALRPERIYTIPKELGYYDERLEIDDLYTDVPHPFP